MINKPKTSFARWGSPVLERSRLSLEKTKTPLRTTSSWSWQTKWLISAWIKFIQQVNACFQTVLCHRMGSACSKTSQMLLLEHLLLVFSLFVRHRALSTTAIKEPRLTSLKKTQKLVCIRQWQCMRTTTTSQTRATALKRIRIAFARFSVTKPATLCLMKLNSILEILQLHLMTPEIHERHV
jgi:hypothetical protein